jgi:hypothetical protein
MVAQSEGEDSQSPRWRQDSSQSNASSATTTIPSTPSAPPATTGSQQTHLKDEFEELAAYLADVKAPKKVGSAFRRIHDAFLESVEKQATMDALHTLQEAVRKLAAKIEEKPVGTNTTGRSRSLLPNMRWAGVVLDIVLYIVAVQNPGGERHSTRTSESASMLALLGCKAEKQYIYG